MNGQRISLPPPQPTTENGNLPHGANKFQFSSSKKEAPPESPLQPIPPPSKKQRGDPYPRHTIRGTGQMDDITKMTDESIARRREQLRKLQMKNFNKSGMTSESDKLLAKARAMTSSRYSNISQATTIRSTLLSKIEGGGSNNEKNGSAPMCSPIISVPKSAEFATPSGPSSTPTIKREILEKRNEYSLTCNDAEFSKKKVSKKISLHSKTNNVSTDTASLTEDTSYALVRNQQFQSSDNKTPDTASEVKSSINKAALNSMTDPDSHNGVISDQMLPNIGKKILVQTNASANTTEKLNTSGSPNESTPNRQSSRHETLSVMRSGAPSPMQPPTTKLKKIDSTSVPALEAEPNAVSSVKIESTQLRLVKDLNRVTKEKQNALIKISQLQAEIARLNVKKKEVGMPLKSIHKKNNSEIQLLSKLVEIACKEGNIAAMNWAKEQRLLVKARLEKSVRIGRDKSLIDDDDNGPASSPIRGRSNISHLTPSRRKRLKSPQPTSRLANPCPLSDNETASRAVETVDDVYSSDFAKYFVRKPYGGNEMMICKISESENGEDIIEDNAKVKWLQSVQLYLKKANVQDETTIEVIAKIYADESVIMLYGLCNIRHGIVKIGENGNIDGYEWKSYENVENMEGILGRIMYIDVDGNDGEYWLDSIYEEAIKIRETYCSNVFSAAQAVKATSREFSSPLITRSPPLSTPKAVIDKKKVDISKLLTADASVGTDDRVAQIEHDSAKDNKIELITPPPTQSKILVEREPVLENDLDDSGSTDALSSFLILFVSSIFRVCFFFVIRLPLKLIWQIIVSFFLCSSLALLWLYLADDNGAMELGAGVDYNFVLGLQ